MRRGLAYFLFLLSGATALCYEVAWTRHLVLVFGSTTRAVALILAAYMLGLALGSDAGGRLADRVKRPAIVYAIAEGLIGLYAFAFPWMVGAARGVYLGLGTAATPVLFLGAFLLLLVPTFLMGATLPLLVRATVDDPGETGGVVGRLYGVNILGAVLGTSLTGFWLMEAAGVMGATRWAAGVNVAIAAIGFVAFRGSSASGWGVRTSGAAGRTNGTGPVSRFATRDPDSPGASRGGPRAHLPPLPADLVGLSGAPGSGSDPGGIETGDFQPNAPANPTTRAALVSVFAAGLVGLAAEVLWTRLLTFTLQGFTYTFSAMLATFLLGLALGGFAFGRIAARTPDPVRVLVRLHVAVGVLAAAVLLALSYHHPLSSRLWDVAGAIAGRTGDVRARHIVQLVLSSAVILLPPAFLMGGVFPLAAAAYRRGLGDLGARVGRLYAINTVGAVTGSLLAGFVMAPLAGLTWGAAWVAFLSIAAAVAVVAAGGGTSPRRWGTPALGALAVAALVALARPDTPYLMRSHVFAGEKARENRLVETRSGAVCQVSVVENERERYRLLYTDEFEAAGTKPEYRYMRLLAHLPIALAADPSRVLVICFGTGTTTGSVSTHSAVKRLDVVEISPEVLDVADQFHAVNRDALRGAGRKDLDVAVHVDDGRSFVQRSQETWGVITLEPLMPYTPAAIHLYTEDFYRECAPRLAPGGVMCQWIPLQGMSGDDFKRLVAAFVAVFPDSACFFVDGAVALIGGNQPFAMPYARVALRLSDPVAKEDLADVGFDDPVRALATFVAGGEVLLKFAADVPPVTDEFPVLEFHPLAPRVLTTHLWENVQAMQRLRESYTRLPVDLTGVAASDDIEAGLDLALRAGRRLLNGAVAVEAGNFRAAQGKREDASAAVQIARAELQAAVSIDTANANARRAYEQIEREWATGLGVSALRANDFSAAERHFRRALEFRAARQADVAWTRLAETLSRAERFEDALAAATEATRLYPRGIDALAERAYARAALHDMDGAAWDYRRALSGGALEQLPSPRLRQDAERVLATIPEARSVVDLDARIESALRGVSVARIPTSHILAICAADDRDRFAAHFAGDLAVAASRSAPPADRLAAMQRLAAAMPEGSAVVAMRVLAEPAAETELLESAATVVIRRNPVWLRDLMLTKLPQRGMAAAAFAAGRTGRLMFVDVLLPLLLDDAAGVRRAAQVALFALVGDRAPGLGRLDLAAFPSSAYRTAVQDLRAWWTRERGGVESGR